MVKPDKYQKTKFSRDKVQVRCEEDIIKNDKKIDQQREKRNEERDKNLKQNERGNDKE